MTQGTLAITGGTGLVGSTLIRLAVEQGYAVRALARRPQAPVLGVEWIAGSLSDPKSLDAMLADASAIIHVAGVTNAPDRAGFAKGNIDGTAAMVAAARRADIRRFVHVSSLSAREPGLSNYGWSKAEAEHVVEQSGLDWTIIRPPAIYGPGDHEQLDLFKAARLRVIPMPPAGKASLIEVSDLARLLLAVVRNEAGSRAIYEADDGRVGGWSYAEYARAIADAMAVSALAVPLPAVLVRAGAALDRLFRGDGAKLTADRAAYMCHPDWVIDPTRRPPAALWQAQVETRAGLAATADWYRREGWL